MKEPTKKRVVPQNIRAEEAIIGKIIGSSETYWQVSDYLTADQFVLPHHRMIFEAVKECCETGSGPSLSLLESKLPVEFEGVGSREPVLLVLMERASDVGSALDFVHDVTAAWRERKRVELGKVAAEPRSFDETRQAIDDLLRNVDDHDRARHAVKIGEAAENAMQKAADAYQHQGRRAVGVLTGVAEIDKALGPQIPGTTITIAAASGHGKSALLSQILRNSAGPSLDPSSVFPSLLFSLEMSREQVGYRDLSALSGIPVRKQITGDFNQKEFTDLQRARARLAEMPIYIQDRGRLTIKQIGNECRIAARRYGVKQFGLDHLKLIEPEKEHWNLVRTIEYASAYTKDLAKELGAVFWQLAQITRDGQSAANWRFKATNIYGGGLIVENSDIVLGLAIPRVWLRENKPEPPSDANPKGREAFDGWLGNMEKWKDRAEFAALKVRSGSGASWTELAFDGPRMSFGEINDREPIPF